MGKKKNQNKITKKNKKETITTKRNINKYDFPNGDVYNYFIVLDFGSTSNYLQLKISST